MDYLWAWRMRSSADPRLRGELDYRPNSSLYQVGDRLLFAEELRGQAGILLPARGRGHDAVPDADPDPGPGRRATGRPGGRARQRRHHARRRRRIPRRTRGSQILVADIRPQLTGPPSAGTLAASLERHERSAGLARALGQAADGLAAIDADGIGFRPSVIARSRMPSTACRYPPNPRASCRSTMMKPAAEVTLGADVVSELERGVAILHALSRLPQARGPPPVP